MNNALKALIPNVFKLITTILVLAGLAILFKGGKLTIGGHNFYWDEYGRPVPFLEQVKCYDLTSPPLLWPSGQDWLDIKLEFEAEREITKCDSISIKPLFLAIDIVFAYVCSIVIESLVKFTKKRLSKKTEQEEATH